MTIPLDHQHQHYRHHQVQNVAGRAATTSHSDDVAEIVDEPILNHLHRSQQIVDDEDETDSAQSPPIDSTMTRFHHHHGNNIVLMNDNSVAYRKASFAHALTFSEKPLLPGELFLIEIEQNERGWSGHLRLGLTQLDPSTHFPLPQYALPDLANIGSSWIFAVPNNSEAENNVNHINNQQPTPMTSRQLHQQQHHSHHHHHHPHHHHRLRRRNLRPTALPAPIIIPNLLNTTNSDPPAYEDMVPRSGVSLRPTSLPSVPMVPSLDNSAHRSDAEASPEEVENDISEPSTSDVADRLPTPHRPLLNSSHLRSSTASSNSLPTDVGSRVGIMYLIRGDLAELHFIFNGEDQGVYCQGIPYREAPLYAVVDVYGTTKQVRIVQLCGLSSLQSACRDVILSRCPDASQISTLPLPKKLKDYLLYQ